MEQNEKEMNETEVKQNTRKQGRPKKMVNQDAEKEFINKIIEEEKPFEEYISEPVEETKDSKTKKLAKKIAKGISWLIMGILLFIGGLLLIYIAVNKIAQAKGETPPLGLYTIISPSMTPNIQVYDVVFVKKTNPEDIHIGDIISYYSTNDYFGNIPITHRVVEKFNTNQGITFKTKGDANPVKDEETIFSNNVVGVVKGVIPQLGRVQFFLSSKLGWITVILIPALGILIYDVLKLIKLVKAKSDVNKVRKALAE